MGYICFHWCNRCPSRRRFQCANLEVNIDEFFNFEDEPKKEADDQQDQTETLEAGPEKPTKPDSKKGDAELVKEVSKVKIEKEADPDIFQTDLFDFGNDQQPEANQSAPTTPKSGSRTAEQLADEEDFESFFSFEQAPKKRSRSIDEHEPIKKAKFIQMNDELAALDADHELIKHDNGIKVIVELPEASIHIELPSTKEYETALKSGKCVVKSVTVEASEEFEDELWWDGLQSVTDIINRAREIVKELQSS